MGLAFFSVHLYDVSRLTCLAVRQMLIQIINNDIYYAARRNRINKGPEVPCALFFLLAHMSRACVHVYKSPRTGDHLARPFTHLQSPSTVVVHAI